MSSMLPLLELLERAHSSSGMRHLSLSLSLSLSSNSKICRFGDQPSSTTGMVHRPNGNRSGAILVAEVGFTEKKNLVRGFLATTLRNSTKHTGLRHQTRRIDILLRTARLRKVAVRFVG